MGSYAVVWREEEGPLRIGRLELQPDRVLLDGGLVCRLPYSEIEEARVGRCPRERIAGRPTLLVRLRSGPGVAIATIGAPGALAELAERLLLQVAV